MVGMFFRFFVWKYGAILIMMSGSCLSSKHDGTMAPTKSWFLKGWKIAFQVQFFVDSEGAHIFVCNKKLKSCPIQLILNNVFNFLLIVYENIL